MLEPLITHLKSLLSGSAQTSADSRLLDAFGWNVRTAATAVRAAQSSLARAKAEQQQDRNRLRQTTATIEDLENRARNALLKGADGLALEAAEAIALLEDERAALEAAIQSFDADLATLTDQLHQAQSRLRALKRGERSAEVRDRILKARSISTGAGGSALVRAEEQLEDIRQNQERAQLTDREYAALDPAGGPGGPQALIGKLAGAGCGAPVRTSAQDILQRLKADTPVLLSQNN